MRHSASRLPALLAAVYALLVLYACLHPLWGWHDSGVAPLDFLDAGWPRYGTRRDLVLNFLGFVPLGFLATAAARAHIKAGWAVLGVTLACGLLSFTVEIVQNYLPSRVPSNVDLGMNLLGGFAGALLGARWHGVFDPRGALHRWRVRRILPGRAGEFGLILLSLWWLAQLSPGSMLFASGDLRPLFDLPATLEFSAGRFIALETAIVAAQWLAVGLIVLRVMRVPSVGFVIFVPVCGLLVVTLATTLFVSPQEPLRWASPGALYGLTLGSVLLLAGSRLPAQAQHMLACMALLGGTVLVNIAPQNPFVTHISRVMMQGHALNFLGLTELVARLWPFAALAWLAAQGPRRAGDSRAHEHG